MFFYRFLLLFSFSISLLQAQASDAAKFTQVYENSEKGAEKPSSKTQSELLGKELPTDVPIVIGQHSRVEFGKRDYLARVGGIAQFQLTSAGGIKLSRGVVLIQPVSKEFKMDFTTEKSAFSVEGAGCFQIETTTNGGCKLMLLTGISKVRIAKGNEQSLIPGNLIFLLPGKTDFGPTLDIDLGLLCSTSRLVNGFQSPLSRVKEFRAAAFFQRYRTKGKSNALIGDASNERDYQVIFVK